MRRIVTKGLTLLATVVGLVSIQGSSQPAAKASPPAYSKSSDRIVLHKNNTIYLHDQFDWSSTADVQNQVRVIDAAMPSNEPIILVLDSPGGYIDAGLEMITNLASLNRPVHTLTLFAASMGFQTVQGLGDRLILPAGTLMAHKARGGFGGEFPGQIDSRYGYWVRRVLKLDEIVAARSNGKLTTEKFRSLYENELWCDGQDCVDIGVADRVVTAVCDTSLSGTSKVVLATAFTTRGTLQLVGDKANCPLTTGYTNLDITINGRSIIPKPGSKEQVNGLEEIPTYSREEVIQAIQPLKEKMREIEERGNNRRQVVRSY